MDISNTYPFRLEDLSHQIQLRLWSRDISHSHNRLYETIPPGLIPIAYTIEAALFSSYVKGIEKLSLLIIAPPGSGKTELLKAYSQNRGVEFYNDFTAYGLYQLLSQIQAGLINHILVGDLVRLTMRGPAIWHQIMLSLNSLIEEGITNIDTFYIRFHSKVPIKAGVIAALTTEEWRARRAHWIKYGFLSRAIPISYTLAPEDILKAEKLIYSGEQPFKPVILEFPSGSVDVEIPASLEPRIKRLARILAAVNSDETGFRSHKHLIGFAKSLALRDGRDVVESADLKLLQGLSLLWISPYTADEPSFRIMLELPSSSSELVEKLSSSYSRATIYRRIQYLEKMHAIKLHQGKWIPNL